MKGFSALLVLLALAIISVDCRETMCSSICHVACDTGEDIYNRWMDMTPQEITESAEECNEICDPVCDCLQNCLYKCFAQLRDCRFLAGSNIVTIYACQSQFQQCGQPCDDQRASAVTLAGTKIQKFRNRIMTALAKFLCDLWEDLTQPSSTQPYRDVGTTDSGEQTTGRDTDSGERRSDSRARHSAKDNESGNEPSAQATDSAEAPETTMDSGEEAADSEGKSDEESTNSNKLSSGETVNSKEQSEEDTKESHERI